MPPKSNMKQGTKRPHNDIEDDEPPPPRRNERRKPVKEYGETQLVTNDYDQAVPSSQATTEAITAMDKHEIVSDPNFPIEFSENLKQDMRKARDQSSNLFQSYVNDEAAFRKAFNEQVSAALNAPSMRQSNQASKGPKLKESSTRHSLWDDSQKVVQLCLALKGRYQEACQAVDHMESSGSLGEQWQEDHRRLAEELQMGYNVTERQIARVVGRNNGDRNGGITTPEEAMEEQRVAQVLFMKVPKHTVGVNGEISFGETLRYAESGLKRFTRGLPVTETIEE